MKGAIRAHGQGRAQCLLGAIGAERDDHHFALATLFLDAQGLLHGELVIRGDDPGDAGRLDSLAAGGDLDLRRRVGHLLDTDNDLHARAPFDNGGS